MLKAFFWSGLWNLVLKSHSGSVKSVCVREKSKSSLYLLFSPSMVLKSYSKGGGIPKHRYSRFHIYADVRGRRILFTLCLMVQSLHRTGCETHDTWQILAEDLNIHDVPGGKKARDCTVDYSWHKLAVLLELESSNFQWKYSKYLNNKISTLSSGWKWIIYLIMDWIFESRDFVSLVVQPKRIIT